MAARADATEIEAPEENLPAGRQALGDGVVYIEGTDDDEEEDARDDDQDPPTEDDDDPADEAQVEDDDDGPAEEEAPGGDADADVPDAPAEPEYEPFAVKFDGRRIEVPHAEVFTETLADGRKERFVLMPEAEFQRHIQPVLGDRGKWRQEKEGLLKQVAELNPDTNEVVVRAKALADWFTGLVDRPEEEVLTELERFRSELPVWTAKQEAEALRARLAERDGVVADPDPVLDAANEEELEGQMRAKLEENIQFLAASPELRGLIEANSLLEELWEISDKVFFQATDAEENGYPADTVFINEKFVANWVARRAGERKALRDSLTAAQEAERKNKAALRPTPGARPKAQADAPRKPRDTPRQRDLTPEQEYQQWKDQFVGEDGDVDIVG